MISNDALLKEADEKIRDGDLTDLDISTLKVETLSKMLLNAQQLQRNENILPTQEVEELREYVNTLSAELKTASLEDVKESAALLKTSLMDRAEPAIGDRIIYNYNTAEEPVFMLGTIKSIKDKAVIYHLDNGVKGRGKFSDTLSSIVGFSNVKRLVLRPIDENKLSMFVNRNRWMSKGLTEYLDVPIENYETPEESSEDFFDPLEKVSPSDIIGRTQYAAFGLTYYPKPNTTQAQSLFKAIAKLVGGRMLVPVRGVRSEYMVSKDGRYAYLDPITRRHWIMADPEEDTETNASEQTVALSDIGRVIKFIGGN